MPEATLSVKDLLGLPEGGFPAEVLRAGISDDEANSFKTKVAGALHGMQMAGLEAAVSSKLAEVLDEVEGLDEIRVPGDDVDRSLELRSARARNRRADLVDEDVAQRFEVVAQCSFELAQAPHAERVVAAPLRGVERAPGRADRTPRVVDGRVGGHAENLLRRR